MPTSPRRDDGRAFVGAGLCPARFHNPSVNASRCHLPLHKGGEGDGFPRQSADWLGMTPLRGGWADKVVRSTDGRKGCGGQMAGGAPQGHLFRFAPQRRTPPLYTKYRTAQLCISEQKRQRKEKQRQCNISVKFPRHSARVVNTIEISAV